MNRTLESALFYAENGLAVFPLVPNAKNPLTENGFKNATTNADQIKKWWNDAPFANIGIACGSRSGGLVVIDMDIKHGGDGINTFNEWIDENYLYLQNTCVVETYSGGRHLYLRSKDPVPSRIAWLKDVDVRAEGGYVVAPPSSINNEEYSWIVSLEDTDIATSENDEDIGFIFDEIRKGKTIQSGTKFEVPETVSEGGRNDKMYKLACSMQATGMDDEAIMLAVKVENAKKCKPPLPDDEIERTVRSALKKEKGLSPEYAKKKEESRQKQASEESSKLDFALMEPRSLRSLINTDIPDIVKYIGTDSDVPLLAEGTCVLSAKSKTGKSWLCLNLCIALATGSDFLGYKTKKCKVQYYDLEQDDRIKKNRAMKLLDSLGIDVPDGVFISSQLQRIGHGFIEQLEYDMKNNPDIGVFVIDVFEIVRTEKKQTETDYSWTYRDFRVVNEFAHAHHVSVILLFHSRKMVDTTDPFSDILGSTAIQGASDQMIVIFKDKFNDKTTKLISKGRTLDGLIETEYVLENGICNQAIAKSKSEELLEEYMASEIRIAVKKFMEKNAKWKGRCGQFINECERVGIDIPDKPKELGIFLNKHQIRLEKMDGIKLEVSKNGNAGSIYTLFTIDTIDEWENTIDEIPFKDA